MRSVFLVLWISGVAAAQNQATPLPSKHIPPPVLMELRGLENQFDLALARDCAPEKCVSKGCVYRDHAAVDLPRAGSLPGLGQAEGPGSVPVQEYLTQARCDFAHEKSVSTRDVQALVRRLEQRLSKGWLQVDVGRQILEPISPSLADSPPPKPEPAPKEEPKVAAPPPAPVKWESEQAWRELWLSLLPHFSWMIALVLVTLAAMTLIWALRRLGKESAEEKALLAQLTAPSPAEPSLSAAPATAEAAVPPVGPEGQAFVSEQQRVWADRIANTELAKNEGLVVELLHGWLKAREFDLLAKAILIFGDRLSVAFSSDGELAERKVEFAEYLRQVDEATLPSDAEFFRKLNQHAISWSLLGQSDAETYRSLQEEFGSAGVASLLERLAPRHGAVLFGLLPPEHQQEVARLLSSKLRVALASQLLVSNRVSREERGYVFEALDSARAGLALPAPPKPTSNEILDRGHEFDAAGALSVLLPHIDVESRRALFAQVLTRFSGVFPRWYEDILYPEMLLKVPEEVKADLLLEVDLKGLAGWSSLQPPVWQQDFLNQLSPSLQKAVRANMAFASRADQLQQARRGRNELVAAVKRRVAGGALSFSELVG